MDICIKYCNNIDEANISIAEGFLNIKFGINGTGKSTVSKAIEINSRDVKDLVELTPFKLLEDNPDGLQPTVEGCDEIGSVAFFSEDYIDQFVFKQDELISNSFEIFVKNQQYQQKLEEIEVVVAEINKTFKDNAEIDQVIDDLGELSGCFGKAKSGYSKASAIGKGIGSGNKIENIPKGLELYTEFLKSDQNTNWIKWQIKGNEFLELSDNCPYCVAPAKEKHEEIRLVSSEYDAKSIEHLIKVLSVVERLGQYFSEEARDNLYSITRNKTDLSKEEIVYLKQVKEQIDTLKDKLLNLKKITFFTFDDVGKVIEVIESLKINLGLLALLDSKATRKIVDQLNVSLDTVLDMAGPLQGMVNQQKAAIRSTIDSRKKEINDFLKFAGYRYSVEIEGDNQEYKLKLRHHDISSSVAGGSQYLSYGEKNEIGRAHV